jgi:hypothetical protein
MTFFFAEEVFFFGEAFATFFGFLVVPVTVDRATDLPFFLVVVDFGARFVFLFWAAGFFFAVVFVFRGFLADTLRTDFLEAINDPFYFGRKKMFLERSSGNSENNTIHFSWCEQESVKEIAGQY